MNGKTKTFFRMVDILFFSGFICWLVDWLLASVDFAYDVLYVGIDFLVCKDFLCRVHDKDVNAIAVDSVFESSPAFPYTTFQQVALDCSLEVLFRYRNKKTAMIKTVIRYINVSELS